MSTVGAPPATKVRYILDAKRSRFTVKAFATGILSAFGHSPTIGIAEFHGEVQFASGALQDASARIVIQADALKVTDDVSEKDRREIEAKMREDVLNTARYPEVVYDCPRILSAQKLGEGLYMVTLNGELSLHGVTRNQPVSARVTLQGDVLKAAGEFTLRQSDYEIKPVSAAGGTVKVKDELKLTFDITARKQN